MPFLSRATMNQKPHLNNPPSFVQHVLKRNNADYLQRAKAVSRTRNMAVNNVIAAVAATQ